MSGIFRLIEKFGRPNFSGDATGHSLKPCAPSPPINRGGRDLFAEFRAGATANGRRPLLVVIVDFLVPTGLVERPRNRQAFWIEPPLAHASSAPLTRPDQCRRPRPPFSVMRHRLRGDARSLSSLTRPARATISRRGRSATMRLASRQQVAHLPEIANRNRGRQRPPPACLTTDTGAGFALLSQPTPLLIGTGTG